MTDAQATDLVKGAWLNIRMLLGEIWITDPYDIACWDEEVRERWPLIKQLDRFFGVIVDDYLEDADDDC